MATASKSAWTKEHEDALSGLVGLGISKKEARQFLETLASENSGELMRKALASRSRSQRPPPAVPSGGPGNAVPITVPPPAPQPTAPRAVPQSVSPQPPVAQFSRPPAPMQVQAGAEAEAEAARQAAIKKMSSGWSSLMAPKAPIQAAAAQLQASPEKPRVRVRAAGSRIPPAPLGGEGPSEEAAPPTKEAQTPSKGEQTPSKLPRIRSEEELAGLSPGTEFVWVPDGHIYRKNE